MFLNCKKACAFCVPKTTTAGTGTVTPPASTCASKIATAQDELGECLAEDTCYTVTGKLQGLRDVLTDAEACPSLKAPPPAGGGKGGGGGTVTAVVMTIVVILVSACALLALSHNPYIRPPEQPPANQAFDACYLLWQVSR